MHDLFGGGFIIGEYRIHGGQKISGEIQISGAKNAILPILASVMLNSGESIIHNCPKITDTFISIEILEEIGCKTKMEGSTLIIDSSMAKNFEIPEKLVQKMRSSILFLGGMLGRFKKVRISYPGGCELGLRPIDLHLKAIKQMGATIKDEHGFIVCSAEKLKGTHINMDFPSVGATENIMLAAVMAEGDTVITNTAREPEIVDLQRFLNGMGADINGAGTDTIVIRGVKKLHNVEHVCIPDRIVAGTFLVAAAITKGSITLNNVIHDHLYPITGKLRETGCVIRKEGNRLHLKAPEALSAINKIRTYPHPGFQIDNKGI